MTVPVVGGNSTECGCVPLAVDDLCDLSYM